MSSDAAISRAPDTLMLTSLELLPTHMAVVAREVSLSLYLLAELADFSQSRVSI